MKDESRVKKSAKNLIFGLFFKLVGIMFPFIIKSLIIIYLGIEYLGLNSLFASIISVLSLTELGIGSAMVFSMYKPVADKDYVKINALLCEYKRIYRKIGLFILLLGILLLPFLRIFINGSYPAQINIYVLFLIYLLDTVLSYFMSANKYALLEAYQKNSVESLIHSVVSIFMYMIQIIILIFTKNYYLYLVIMPISTFALNIFRSYIVKKMYPYLFAEGKLEKEDKREIFSNVKALIGHKIGTTVITSADSIVISSFLGLQMVAIYGNYNMIISTLIGLITVFYNSILSSVGNVLVVETKEKAYSKFQQLVNINNWIVGWCTICLLCLFQPFMNLWMGEKLMFPFHIIVLLSIYFYTWLIRRIGLTFKDAAGLWRNDFWKPYIGSIVNLATNIIMVMLIGIEGVIISTIIVMVFIYFPWETLIVHRDLFNKNCKDYLNQLFKFTIITIANAVITYIICNCIKLNGIFDLLYKALICLIIPNLLFFLFYKQYGYLKDIKMCFMKKHYNNT